MWKLWVFFFHAIWVCLNPDLNTLTFGHCIIFFFGQNGHQPSPPPPPQKKKSEGACTPVINNNIIITKHSFKGFSWWKLLFTRLHKPYLTSEESSPNLFTILDPNISEIPCCCTYLHSLYKWVLTPPGCSGHDIDAQNFCYFATVLTPFNSQHLFYRPSIWLAVALMLFANECDLFTFLYTLLGWITKASFMHLFFQSIIKD